MDHDLEKLVEKTKKAVGEKGFRGYLDDFVDARDACEERGYHRVDSEPIHPNPEKPDDLRNLLICYDCDLWFGKYDGTDVEYRVEKS